MSVEKLERMIYELSLMEMTGREYTSNLETDAQPDEE
jgi:hypothetical protein